MFTYYEEEIIMKYIDMVIGAIIGMIVSGCLILLTKKNKKISYLAFDI